MKILIHQTLILLALVSFANALPVKDGFSWNPVQLGNQTFVPIAKISAFYHCEMIKRDGDTLTLKTDKTTLLFSANSHAVYINGVKFLISYPVKKQNSHLYLSVHDLRSLIDAILHPPQHQTRKKLTTVVLDPGHGGHDRGAAKKESQFTLTLALQIKSLLEKQGFKVVMTREKDEFVSLTKRVQTANAQQNAILISLHFNSGHRDAKGYESYVMSAQNNIRETNAASISLAWATHSHALQKIGTDSIQDRGIRRAKFHLLQQCQHPSVLIEAGFLTNKAEAAMINTKKYQIDLALGITQGIQAYKNSLGE